MSSRNLFSELSRRNVYKVAITYAACAWLVFEIASLLLPVSDASTSILKTLIALLAVGLIIAVTISWKFEATPDGLKRTENVPAGTSLPTWSPRKYATFVIAVAAIAAGLTAYQLFRSQTEPSRVPEQAGSVPKP